MTTTPPHSLINEYSEIIARPAFRAVAYLYGREALPRVEGLIGFIQARFRGDMEVAGGTHLRPKNQRHAAKDKDFAELSQILDDKARFSGFYLFGSADLKDSSFELPMIRIQRGGFRFVIEFAFAPNVEGATIQSTWDAITASSPDFALCGFGLLPDPNYHEHERRQTAKAKARYRHALCLDAVRAATVVQDEGALENYNQRAGEKAELGIYDLGWKTMVGSRFLSRLDRPALDASGADIATLPDTGAIAITAGDQPSWGDVNAGPDPDTEVRRKVLQALRPLMASKGMMLALGGLDDTTEAADIIDTYFAEWPSEVGEPAR